MYVSKELIEACQEASIACESCITICNTIETVQCSLLCRDCADICNLSARFEARGSRYSAALFSLCIEICNACAIECSKHSSRQAEFKNCAEASRRYVEVCEELLIL